MLPSIKIESPSNVLFIHRPVRVGNLPQNAHPIDNKCERIRESCDLPKNRQV